ncbi:Transposon Tf2-8 polyprotein [Phytophthora ramorum]|nr:Transposon Tf2-8 polyprotein [Phytophthora ramorum]
MARWLSFFGEYNFQVEYKPGRLNVVADALSRRPDYAVQEADANCVGVVRTTTPSSSLLDDVKAAYAHDADAKPLLEYFSTPSDKSRQKLAKHLRARVHRYRVHNGLLLYSAVDDNADRIVVPDDHELKLKITYEYHDAPTSGHPGREKTYLLLTRDFYWSHQYKWVRKYVRACEVCQRVKPAPNSQAPLQSLPTPSECWQSISMDFVFGLPQDNKRRTGIVVFVDRFSKMVHLAAVPAEVTAKQTACLFVDMVFRHHGMPLDIVSDRDPRFTARFWQEVFTRLGTQLSMSTADHPQTDGQTERVNRVLVDTIKSYAHSFHQWSDCLPMAEFAINNSVHVSTGHTPFYVNTMRHPRVPSVLGAVAPSLRGGGYPVNSKQPDMHADTSHVSAVTTRARTARSHGDDNTVSTTGVDTLNDNEHHAQAGPAANKEHELNQGFSSDAMDFVQRRQAVIQFVQDAIAASVDRQKLNADNTAAETQMNSKLVH